MIDFRLVQIEGALARRESRGAHLRMDDTDENGEPQKVPRDDENWLKHTYATIDNDMAKLTLISAKSTS